MYRCPVCNRMTMKPANCQACGIPMTADASAARPGREDEIAAVAAAAGDDGPREFNVTAYTGGELRVAKYDLPIVVDLAGMTIAKDVKANLDHDATKRIGHITDVYVDGREVRLRGLVSATGPSAKEFEADHDNGYPWKASVEVRPTKLQEVAGGQNVQVNGRTFSGPIYVARKSILYGVAFLARGADEETSVTISAGDGGDDGAIFAGPPIVFDAEGPVARPFGDWLKDAGFDPDELELRQLKSLRTLYDRENPGSVNASAADDYAGPFPMIRSPIDVFER